MSLIDDVAASLGSSLSVTEGVLPTKRRPGLRDAPLEGVPGYNDRFAPTYTLTVNGVVLPEVLTKRIVSIEYEDNEELFDRLTIRLQGFIPVSDSENFIDSFVPGANRDIPIPEYVVDEPWFSEGNIIWVHMGYGGSVKLIGAAQVVKREFSYTENPSCTIICYEPLHLMASEEPEEAIVYTGLLSSNIVKKIAQKSVYTATKIGALFDVSQIKLLPAFTPRAEVQKKGESDWTFLKRLADIRGWELFTRFKTKGSSGRFVIFYGPDVDKQQVVFRYEYRNKLAYPEDNIISFVPEINLIDQSSEVEIIAFDDQRKQKLSSKESISTSEVNRKLGEGSGSFDKKELKNPQSYRVQAFGQSTSFTTNRPFKDENEVKKYIINLARQKIKHFITGRAVVPGNEDLQSRQNIILAGLGIAFSGTASKPANWYISKCTHRMSGGSGGLVYTTDLEVRKAVDFLPNDDLTTDLASTVSSAIGF